MARSPLFGGASWTVRAPSHEGWVVAGGGDELPVALPTLFAVRGAELAGSSGEIRIYGTEEARAPDADALAARLARNHAALSEAFGAFDARWDVLPVHYGSGYESTSGYPSIGVGYRMVGEGDALAHEVAHAWFGARVVPSFDQPGGHWHEALATWALMDVDPDAANLLLEFFVNRFRSQTRKRPSVALTQTAYAEASDGEKYGKGLAAMLTLDATYGRAEVVRAVARWVEQSAGRETTWTDVLAAVEQELGAEAAGRLRSWLDGRWVPRLALQDGVLVVDDDADPDHAIEGAVLVTNASYDILAELPVQLGRGRVELGPPPEGWAYAFLAGELPVEGPDIYLFR
ncbi:MAG: hypothetical protein KC621_01845 [Myxococcales bacterium]|nr:hypothetical protein [Myxococcales bacterium]